MIYNWVYQTKYHNPMKTNCLIASMEIVTVRLKLTKQT